MLHFWEVQTADSEDEIEDPGAKPISAEAVAKRLESLRARMGLSVLAFSRHCNVPNSAMRGYLAGTHLPGVQNLYAISLATRASLDWILRGDGPPDSLNIAVLREAVTLALTVLLNASDPTTQTTDFTQTPDFTLLIGDYTSLIVGLYAQATSPDPRKRVSIESKRELVAQMRSILSSMRSAPG